MSDVIERLKRLEGVLLDQCNGNEGHPSYYSAEVVHRAAEQIESIQRENERLEREAKFNFDHLQKVLREYVPAGTVEAITPEMREILKRAFALAREIEDRELAEDLCGLLGEQDA